MGIIAIILHNMGGNPELIETGHEGLTFKNYPEGGPIASQRREPWREPWLL